LDNIVRIERFTAGLNLQAFRENEQVLFAVGPSIEVMTINWQDVITSVRALLRDRFFKE